MSKPKKYWKPTPQNDPLVQQVVDAMQNTTTDPLGSYTGVPAEDPYATPVQDADDL